MRWERFAASMLAVAGFVSASGACAMTAPSSDKARCVVIGGEKLPAETGGADALCDVIRSAVAKEAPNARVTIEVRVLTTASLATKLNVEGKALPEQKFAVMDRQLNRASIERFARSIATKVANAAAH